ncbi:hypothetical protein [Embleya sp. NPDC020886]|uniref:hypothetical protein n=1 Tax=Embleya sp. NPDC020886 TaxID=3363980 RepID=UPI00379A5C55
MTLTIEDLEACSPDALDAVAASWEQLSAAMNGRRESVEHEVIGPLRGGGWDSNDGRRAVELIGYVGAQLEAIRAESGAMASIAREAAGELRAAQNAVRDALEAARRSRITRHPDGRLTWQADTDSEHASLESQAKDIAARIAAALQKATDADVVAANTMRKNVDFGPKDDFNARALGGDSTADAMRATELLSKLDTGKVNAQDLAFLETLLKQNGTNPGFDAELLRMLGPGRLLDATEKLETLGGAGGPKATRETARLIEGRVRGALSTAGAELAGDAEWMRRLKEAGREVEQTTGGPGNGSVFGYQKLDRLLREGTYDTKFLGAVGEDLLAFDKSMNNGQGWGSDPARDPVNGFLVTLSHNADASTDFFTGPKGKAHVEQIGFTHALVDPLNPVDRERPHLDAFGDALVAATTGRLTTPAMAGVVENVMNTLGAKGAPAILGESGALRGSVTEILAKNSESLHLALTQEMDTKDTNAIPRASPIANIPREAMRNVLLGLAEDPANITVLRETEERYSRAALSLIAGDSPTADINRVQSFAHDAGEAYGFLDSVVAKDVLDRAATDDKITGEADKRIERWIGAGANGISAGAVFAAAAATNAPAYGLVATLATTGVNVLVGEFFQALPPDASDRAGEEVHNTYVKGQTQVEKVMKAWMDENPGYSQANLVNEAGDGYTSIMPTEVSVR